MSGLDYTHCSVYKVNAVAKSFLPKAQAPVNFQSTSEGTRPMSLVFTQMQKRRQQRSGFQPYSFGGALPSSGAMVTVRETGDWNCTHHASSWLLPGSRCTGIPRTLCHSKLKRFGLRRKSPAASSCNEPHKAVDGNSHMATCVPESMTKTTVVLCPRVRKPFPGLRKWFGGKLSSRLTIPCSVGIA